MKKILKISFVLVAILFFTGFYIDSVRAEEEIIPEQIVETEEETPEPININLKIRSGETIFFDAQVELLPVGETEINEHALNARSVLATLNKADIADDNWNISDLQYFDTFGSFLLNCINSSVGNNCYDWQYAVNGNTPGEGMDKKILGGGENIYIYFSPQNRVTLNASTIITTDSLLVTAEKYNFEDNTWVPANDLTLGITQPDPANSFNPPIEIMTSPTDLNGQATFISIPAGLYDVGIRDSFGYYFPTKPLTVNTPPPSGGGGGGTPSSKPKFSTEDALSYLKSVQNEDGSFARSDLYTDWAAIAYGAGKVSNEARDSLLEYFNSHNDISSLITDNERRAMALLALGKNPHSFNETNYIKAIIKEFDETQFGDNSLVNDDIFALIPLNNAGYDENDNIVTKTIDFIISKQENDGSWEDSVDITAAAILALEPFQSISSVLGALEKAETYLMNTQENDGGWGNISSTSWAIQAENALGSSWYKNDKNGLDYLALKQKEADNGGALLPSSENEENIIWATSYAVPAGFGKTWNEIMKKVSKPKEENNDESSSSSSSKDNDVEETEETTETENPTPIIENIVSAVPVVSEQITKIHETKKLPTITKGDTSPQTKEKEENNANNSLTATAINTLPQQNTGSPQNFTIILGTISTVVLLFATLKYIAIF
jgi:hypothetical protein